MRFYSALALCLFLLMTKLYAGELLRPHLQLYGVGDPAHSVTLEQFDVIGPAIDLRVLKANASLQHLTYFYKDQASRKFYGQRLRKHAGLDRPIALLERSLLLAPHRGDLYRELNELYSARGEVDKQRGLMQRLERIDLDQADGFDAVLVELGDDDSLGGHLKWYVLFDRPGGDDHAAGMDR